jgi:hypothetical protein
MAGYGLNDKQFISGSRAHSASYHMRIEDAFPENKAAGAWISPPISIQCRG